MVLFRLGILLPFLFIGCDGLGFGSTPDPPVADILGFSVEPNPVPAGSTAILSLVVADGTASGLSYNWSFPDGSVETASPTFEWTAPTQPGEFRIRVVVHRDGNYEPVAASLTVTVVAS